MQGGIAEVGSNNSHQVSPEPLSAPLGHLERSQPIRPIPCYSSNGFLVPIDPINDHPTFFFFSLGFFLFHDRTIEINAFDFRPPSGVRDAQCELITIMLQKLLMHAPKAFITHQATPYPYICALLERYSLQFGYRDHNLESMTQMRTQMRHRLDLY